MWFIGAAKVSTNAFSQLLDREQAIRFNHCFLRMNPPRLDGIEPHWVHGKRAIVEPARLLTAHEVESRVCDYFGSALVDHLAQKVS